ncbi:FkbM family methyltransferase [Methylobacterium sp. J-026]|uniref:FkbM family methyltransferase n=1 Tax=Methylobacterium sp. J-026 TaxID=2836624 RepID=UPI001FBB78C2|nr:FkbM family methyltransferase [Methylobacterium sp. J-026]MCJ2134412.1 FkbM family methyltransferase [Methylobacterium sp. J-026]
MQRSNADRLVVDLGMNNGDDTAYYLRQGFRVVAVEANPTLVKAAERRFAAEISARRLAVLNRAVWDEPGSVTFYVNADNDHWSSIDAGWAGREDSRVEAMPIETINLRDLCAAFGVPYYLKIDIEGADLTALCQLDQLAERPAFVSVEDCRFGFDYISTLGAAGYTAFKLSDQSIVPSLRDETTGANFPPGASGPYADALPGPWRPKDDFIEHYARTVRDRAGRRLAPRTQWWDIHAAL